MAMLQKLAPQQLLALVGIVGGVGLMWAWVLASSQPWLGLELHLAQADGLRVAAVDPVHPNSERIRVGAVLTHAISPDGRPVPLGAETLLAEPDVLAYAQLSEFYRRQSALAAALHTGKLLVRTEQGSLVSLVTRPRPVPATLFPVFLLHAVYALVGLLITAGVWVFRPRQQAAQLLALSGLGYYLMNLGPAVYGGRTLAMNGQWFAALSAINHIGTALHICALAAMMWVFPRRLGRAPVVTALLAAAAVSLLADQLRIGSSATYTHYLPVVIAFVLGVCFAAAQWRASRDVPADRAALRWIVLAVFWAAATSTLLVLIPVLFGHPPVLPQHLAFAPLLIMYIGLVAGITRYRLFDLEPWWFRTWLWAAGGMLVLALDMLLAWLAGLGHKQSLLLGLLLAGFVYFPMRQWLWARLRSADDNALERGVPRMVAALVGIRSLSELDERWPELARQIFQPLDQRIDPGSPDRARVDANGSTLEIPHPLTDQSVVLHHAAGGTRLFTRQDLRLAQALADVGRNAALSLQARASAAREERERIMGDLHDDLGAKLLTIVHAAHDERDQALARSALADLRAVVAVREKRPVLLMQVLGEWRAEFEQRTRLAGIEPFWRGPERVPDRFLPGPAVANIGCILREAVSNAIRHAQADCIELHVAMQNNVLDITVIDNGQDIDQTSWTWGRGTRTMHRRAAETGVDLRLAAQRGGGTRVALRYRLPVSD